MKTFVFGFVLCFLVSGCLDDGGSSGGGGEVETPSVIRTSITTVKYKDNAGTVLGLADEWTIYIDGSSLVERQRDSCSGFDQVSGSSIKIGDTVEYSLDIKADTTVLVERVGIARKVTAFVKDCIEVKAAQTPCGCPSDT